MTTIFRKPPKYATLCAALPRRTSVRGFALFAEKNRKVNLIRAGNAGPTGMPPLDNARWPPPAAIGFYFARLWNSFTRKSLLLPRRGGRRASSSVRAARACELFPYMREIFAGPGRPGPRQFLNRTGREGSSARGVFASTRPIYNDSRQGRNNLAFVGVVGGKGDEHELRAVGQLNVSGVMARFAGPAGL